MLNDKIEKKNHKKLRRKNTSQSGLAILTRHP
jgi:hypothetical protein